MQTLLPLPGGEGRGEGEPFIALNSYGSCGNGRYGFAGGADVGAAAGGFVVAWFVAAGVAVFVA